MWPRRRDATAEGEAEGAEEPGERVRRDGGDDDEGGGGGGSGGGGSGGGGGGGEALPNGGGDEWLARLDEQPEIATGTPVEEADLPDAHKPPRKEVAALVLQLD